MKHRSRKDTSEVEKRIGNWLRYANGRLQKITCDNIIQRDSPCLSCEFCFK